MTHNAHFGPLSYWVLLLTDCKLNLTRLSCQQQWLLATPFIAHRQKGQAREKERVEEEERERERERERSDAAVAKVLLVQLSQAILFLWSKSV